MPARVGTRRDSETSPRRSVLPWLRTARSCMSRDVKTKLPGRVCISGQHSRLGVGVQDKWRQGGVGNNSSSGVTSWYRLHIAIGTEHGAGTTTEEGGRSVD
ncbi:hypothetical protein CC86DRAFT_759 [Ophiobolus disseminans]|uniref:Uncharacterized protein n=1 Tax=Ophiobolus disseminans TaxID=1469910 RepID=A0A6A7AJF1_9PLEO|nr:hypothetical protein CC86DRAFT_759 [Ophiobolus disseminans]